MSKFKVGDLVEFIEYENEAKWESLYGLDVGDVVVVTEVNGEGLWVLSSEGSHVSVCASRVVKCCEDVETRTEPKPYNPLVAQEGGGHYKDKGIQPLEYTMKNNLSFCEGNVVKYISRYKSKNGVEDLAKVIHYALLASYEVYGEQGSTELKEKVLKLLGEHG